MPNNSFIPSGSSFGVGGEAPADAILAATSTTQGLLAPRMTTVQRDAISTPTTGLVIYDTDLNALYSYNGSTWVPVAGEVADTLYDATVGPSGADYTTVQAAVAAGNNYILVQGSTTEASSTAVPSTGLFIYIERGAVVDMGANNFTYAAAANVTVRGEGEIQYAYSGTARLFDNASHPTSILVMDGITLDNNSTSSSTTVSAAIEYISNVTIELPNVSISGFRPGSTTGASYFNNVHFIGGGTSCDRVLEENSGVTIFASNIYLTGTFRSTVGLGVIYFLNENSRLDGLTLNGSSDIRIGVSGRMGNIKAMANNIIPLFQDDNVNLYNCDLGAGDIDLETRNNCTLTNIQTTGGLDMTSASASHNKFNNCRITSAITVGGDSNKFSDCEFLGGVTISSGADDNGFSNCQFGADAGAGSNTLTINSGSNRTRVTGCMTDAAISDSGTGSLLSNNGVY